MTTTPFKMENWTNTMTKAMADASAMSKASVEAAVKSTSAVAKGLEEITRAFYEFAQASIESNVATAKAAMACTTVKQIVDLQNDFAKTSFDKLVAETHKMSEVSLKVANQVIEPIQAHVNHAMDKVTKVAA